MRIIAAALVFLLSACASAPAQDGSIVGAWRLVRYADTPEGGAPVEAFGAEPIGLFVFTADGRASVSIMRNPPTPNAVADPDPDACLPDWYCSYFGTYTVDWTKPAWTIHVEGANIPSFIGTDQTRAFTRDGDRIVISDTYSDGAQTIRAERILERAR